MVSRNRTTLGSVGLPLTYAYGGPRTFRYLAGSGGLSVVLIYLAVNIAAIRGSAPSSATSSGSGGICSYRQRQPHCSCFPRWGILHPRARTLVDLLPLAALGWLCIGAIVAGVLRTRRPTSFATMCRVLMPGER